MRIKRATAGTLFALAMVGCLPVLSPGNVPGRYVCHLKLSTTQLDIRADHTFRESYQPTAGAQLVCEGRWSWDDKEHRLEFGRGYFDPQSADDAHLPVTSVYDVRLPASCDQEGSMEVLRNGRGLYLEINPDNDDRDFIKQ